MCRQGCSLSLFFCFNGSAWHINLSYFTRFCLKLIILMGQTFLRHWADESGVCLQASWCYRSRTRGSYSRWAYDILDRLTNLTNKTAGRTKLLDYQNCWTIKTAGLTTLFDNQYKQPCLTTVLLDKQPFLTNSPAWQLSCLTNRPTWQHNPAWQTALIDKQHCLI